MLFDCPVVKELYQTGPTTPRISDNEMLREVVDYIRNSLGAKDTLESVATYLNITPRSLERMFQHQTGMPVHHFIIECRMREAKRLIEETNFEVGEIAYTLGYPDAQSFSRAVKKQYGKSPTELRRISKEIRNDGMDVK